MFRFAQHDAAVDGKGLKQVLAAGSSLNFE